MTVPCHTCFLHQRTGGVCPAARETYQEDRSAELVDAVVHDAENATTLLQLISADAVKELAVQAKKSRNALGPASLDTLPDSPHKEAIHVFPSRTD
jgi:hypothetical protein